MKGADGILLLCRNVSSAGRESREVWNVTWLTDALLWCGLVCAGEQRDSIARFGWICSISTLREQRFPWDTNNG